MALSLRALQRLVVIGLSAWFLLLFHFLKHEGSWSSYPYNDGGNRHHRKEFHRLSLGDMQRMDDHKQWQRKTDGYRQGRQFRRRPPPLSRTDNQTDSVPFHGIDPDGSTDTIVIKKPKKMLRKFQNTPGKARGFFSGESSFENRYNSSKGDLKLPLPIIVMGFAKAGTSSIFSFFQLQGFQSQHWYCCKPQINPQKGGPGLMAGCMMKNIHRNHTNLFQGCGDDTLDVFSEINGPRRKKIHPLTGKVGWLQDDGSVHFGGRGIFLPQHFRIQQVHDAFPNATWILNWRDIDSWIKSVINWGDDDLHLQFFNEYYMQGAISEIPSEKNQTDVRALLKKIYQEHYQMVIDFVREHPSHTLVHVNITDEEAGNKLGEAFGLDPRAWTKMNQNKKGEFDSWRRRRAYRQTFDFEDTSLWWLLNIASTLFLGWFLGIEICG